MEATPLDEQQVSKAVQALLAFLSKQEESDILAEERRLYLQFGLAVMPKDPSKRYRRMYDYPAISLSV